MKIAVVFRCGVLRRVPPTSRGPLRDRSYQAPGRVGEPKAWCYAAELAR